MNIWKKNDSIFIVMDQKLFFAEVCSVRKKRRTFVGIQQPRYHDVFKGKIISSIIRTLLFFEKVTISINAHHY